MIRNYSIAIFVLFISSYVAARVAERSDYNHELIKQNIVVTVNNDGSYKFEDSSVFKITQESGKDFFSLYKKHYYEKRNKFKIQEAFVITKGKTHQVEAGRIEEKSVSSEGQGFDSLKEITIAFPALEVGSEVHLRYEIAETKPFVEGHFSIDGILGDGIYEHNSTITVRSKLPISVVKNDPYKIQNIIENRTKDGLYEIVINQKRPHLKAVAEEYSLIPHQEKTSFRISTDKSWSKISKRFTSGFESVLTPNLSNEAKLWIEKAKESTSAREQVNYLTAQMSEYFRYVGDWRTIEGSFQPRALEDIWNTRQGDCKDFAAVLTQMLRALGHKANVALVKRSSLYEKYQNNLDNELKSVQDFNHAIVKLEVSEHNYWIDPTNSSSYLLNHRQDIAGRNALILNKENTEDYQPISDVSSKDIFQKVTKRYVFSSESEAKVNVELMADGEAVLPFLGLEKKIPKNKIKDALVEGYGFGDRSGLVEFKDFSLSDYKYKSLDVSWSYTASRIGESNKAKKVFNLPASPLGQTFGVDITKYKGSLLIGRPQVFHRRYELVGISAVGRFPQNCKVKTDWIDIARTYELTEEGIFVDEFYDLKKAIVHANEYESTDLKMLQVEYHQCFQPQSFSYVFGKNQHSTTSANLATLFSELELEARIAKRKEIAWYLVYSDGRKRVSQYNGQEVMSLMKMNIKEKQNDLESYDLLARLITSDGYLNNSNYTTNSLNEALSTITIGLQFAPNDVGLKIALAKVLVMSKQIDVAKNIYAQIASSGEARDYNHYIGLSWIANKIKVTEDAQKYLYMARDKSITADQKSEVAFRLAQYASDQKNYNKCIEHYTKTTEIDPTYFWAWLNSVNCYIGLKDYDGAIYAGEKSYSLVSYGMSAHNYGRALNAKGTEYLTNGENAKAIEILTKAIAVEKDSLYFANLGEALAKNGELKRAREVIESGIPHVEKNIRSYYTKAANYLKDDMEAYEFFMLKGYDVSTYAGEKLWHFYHLMFNYHDRGELSKAWRYSEKAVQLGNEHLKDTPSDDHVMAEMGKIHFLRSKMTGRLNELVQAEEYFKNALANNPKSKSAKYGLDTLGLTNSLIGREPASVLWKTKAKLHELLLENLEYRLLVW